MIAMVARAGTVYSRDAKDADSYVNYMTGAAREINVAAGHIRPLNGSSSSGLACNTPTQDQQRVTAVGISNIPATNATIPLDQPNTDRCFTYKVNFESDIPILERRLFRLAMAALPQEQAKQFLDQVTKGDAIGAAMAAFKFSAKALDGLHSGAAVHRSGIEIIARQHKSCDQQSDFATVYDAASCMGLPTDDLFVGKHDSRSDYKQSVSDDSFHALMRNIRDSCRMIPLGIDEDALDLNEARDKRIAKCNAIEFRPMSRWS